MIISEPFSGLPERARNLIFFELDRQDLLNLMLVNKSLYTIASNYFWNLPVQAPSDENRIFEWACQVLTLFRGKTLEKKVELIKFLQLGKSFNAAASAAIGSYPDLAMPLRNLASAIIATTSQQQFYDECVPIEAPDSENNLPRVPKPVSDSFTLVLNSHKLCLRSFAMSFDTASKKITFSRSGRLFSLNPRDADIWTDLKDRNQIESVLFAKETLPPATLSLLISVAHSYNLFLDKHPEIKRARSSNLCDFKLIKGKFINFVVGLLEGNGKGHSLDILNTMRNTFREMLSENLWDQLLAFAEGGESPTQERIAAILNQEKATRKQIMIMSLCTMTCAEPKVALDICRSAQKTLDDRSLASRLKFCILRPQDDPGKRRKRSSVYERQPDEHVKGNRMNM